MYSMEPSYLINYALRKKCEGNKYDNFIKIIYCPTSPYLMSTELYQRTLTGMAANNTYSFGEKNTL